MYKALANALLGATYGSMNQLPEFNQMMARRREGMERGRARKEAHGRWATSQKNMLTAADLRFKREGELIIKRSAARIGEHYATQPTFKDYVAELGHDVIKQIGKSAGSRAGASRPLATGTKQGARVKTLRGIIANAQSIKAGYDKKIDELLDQWAETRDPDKKVKIRSKIRSWQVRRATLAERVRKARKELNYMTGTYDRPAPVETGDAEVPEEVDVGRPPARTGGVPFAGGSGSPRIDAVIDVLNRGLSLSSQAGRAAWDNLSPEERVRVAKELKRAGWLTQMEVEADGRAEGGSLGNRAREFENRLRHPAQWPMLSPPQSPRFFPRINDQTTIEELSKWTPAQLRAARLRRR